MGGDSGGTHDVTDDGTDDSDSDSDSDGTPDSNDCAPDDPDVHPGATEVCNDIDDDPADGERDYPDQAGWQSLETELTRLDTTCQTAGYRDIAWGIVVLTGRESSAAQSLLAHVADPKARATITQNVHSVAQTGRRVAVSARAGLLAAAPRERSIEL